MSTNNKVTALERLRAFALYIPGLPEPARSQATAELGRLLKMHGLTEEDLREKGLAWHRLSPQPLTEGERGLAAQLAYTVRWPLTAELLNTDGVMDVKATPEQWGRIEALWSHLLPQFRRSWETAVTPEEERLRAGGAPMGRELDELPKNAVRAFMELAKVPLSGDWSHGTKERENEVLGEEIPPPDEWREAVTALAARMTVEPLRESA